MLVTDAIEEFLVGYFSTHDRSEKTVAAYSLDLRQFTEFLPEPAQRLRGLGPDLLENWASTLRERGYASASIRRKFASLRVFLNYWVRRGALSRSPMWQIRLDLQRERILTPTLSQDEVRRLLLKAHENVGRCTTPTPGFAETRDAAVIEVLFATGIRVGELTALQLGDYRRSAGEFLIRGKGARQRLAIVSDRVTREIVDKYVAARDQLSTRATAFFLGNTGRPLTTQAVAGILRRVAKSAGLDRHITPHMMRHTVATLLLRNGADLRIVQEFLGHASITTTERYTHISKRHLETALQEHHPSIRLRASHQRLAPRTDN